MTMESIRMAVANGRFQIRVYQGGKGPELLYLTGAGGLAKDDPFLGALTEHFCVYAPLLPGFEDSEGGEHLRTMLDFTLHTYDVWEALRLRQPMVVGHSMGGMIAAEMAAIAPAAITKLALISPAGLWLDKHPIPDLFATMPYELPELLVHDPEKHGALVAAGGDLNDPEFLTTFLVDNARRLGTAGKILFPIPDRGLSERLYRIRAQTAILWGASDRLISSVYGEHFHEAIPHSTFDLVQEAGHMLPYERTQTVVERLCELVAAQ